MAKHFLGLILGLTVVAAAQTARADDGFKPTDESIPSLQAKGYAVKAITPVFDQLVSFSVPNNFVRAFEKTVGTSYTQEMVLNGETVNAWTQMITLTGAKGLSAQPKVTAQGVASFIAGGFQKACPASFAAVGLGNLTIDGHEGFAAVAGCGNLPQSGKSQSETALLIAIKGKSDVYTLQWAEHGPASETPIAFDRDRWMARLKTLAPIRLCPILPGEQPPYPSCSAKN